MFSVFWMFVGFLVGLLIASVFTPPLRNDPQLPTPDSNDALYTGKGCVKFSTTEVPCGPESTSLNLLASFK